MGDRQPRAKGFRDLAHDSAFGYRCDEISARALSGAQAMNYILGFLVYLPAALAGGLLVHALWHGTQPAHLLLKFGLGIGLGLGLTSLLTFLILLFTNRLVGFMAIQ